MDHPKLTPSESAVLFVLMAEAREVRNPELTKLGPELKKPSREKLVNFGLVDVRNENRTNVLSLSDYGWAWCAKELSNEPPKSSTPPIRALYAVLAGIGRYIAANDTSLAETFASTPSAKPRPAAEAKPVVREVTIEDRIRAVYRKHAVRPGAWVLVTDIRLSLSDVSRATLDAELVALQRKPGVGLIPQENQEKLSDADRAAAVLVGSQKCHLLAIENK